MRQYENVINKPLHKVSNNKILPKTGEGMVRVTREAVKLYQGLHLPEKIRRGR